MILSSVFLSPKKTITTQKQNNSDYQKEMAEYQKALADYKNKIGQKTVLTSSEIAQALKLGEEPNAKANIELLKTGISDANKYGYESHDAPSKFLQERLNDSTPGALRLDQSGFKLLHVSSDVAKLGGNFAKVTYTNLQNSSFAGKKISKIVATYNQLTDVWGTWGDGVGYIAISNDPYYGTFTYGFGGFGVTYEYYDENGQKINFGDQPDGSGAWISIGSLNSSGPNGRTEAVQLQSPGKLYQLAGSYVTVHPNAGQMANGGYVGNSAFSDTFGLDGGIGSPLGWSDSTAGLSAPDAYKAATVAHVTGDHISFSFYTIGVHNNMWAYPSTIVPVTPGPKKPTLKHAEAHYHYNTFLANPKKASI